MSNRKNETILKLAPSDAIELQRRLRSKVKLLPLKRAVAKVGGVDVSFSMESDELWAAVVIYKYPELVEVESKWVKGRAHFPYIPGLLSFRELPHIIEAIGKLKTLPDVIICDGQGIAHPRGLGIASHLGIMLNCPTIGCAKTRLIGEYSEPGPLKGDYSLLKVGKKTVGVVLRTRDNVRPVFVSPGHMITLDQSIDIIIKTCPKYRIPEPIRSAHNLVNRLRKGQMPA